MPYTLHFDCPGYAARWAPRSRINNMPQPSTEALRPFVNFPMAHTVIAMLNCHYTVNFTSLHILPPQESDHRSLFLFSAFFQRNSQGECTTILLLLKRNEHKPRENEGKFILLVSAIFSNANITVEVNYNCV
jgi:hypothetical protein